MSSRVGDARPATRGDGARTGGIRTRIAASCVRTVLPSSGIGTWCGDAELCGSLLSYGVRRRAANAHARRKVEDGRAGETRTRGLQIR